MSFAGEPIPITRAVFQFENTIGNQLLSVQWFGWYYCQAVAFTPAFDTIKMILGESKNFRIGTLTAYYDPDSHKSNNPFCAIGFGYPVNLRYLDGT